MTTDPRPPEVQTAHWPTCYREHRGCAAAKIIALEVAVDEARQEVVMRYDDGEAVPTCGHQDLTHRVILGRRDRLFCWTCLLEEIQELSPTRPALVIRLEEGEGAQ